MTELHTPTTRQAAESRQTMAEAAAAGPASAPLHNLPAAGKATAKTDVKGWLSRELTSLAVVALYFGCWIAVAIGMKSLVLAEHHITLGGWSAIVIGALVLSKVVLVLEHVSLGDWQRNAPAWVDTAVRTVLYSLGVVVVLIVETGFEGRASTVDSSRPCRRRSTGSTRSTSIRTRSASQAPCSSTTSSASSAAISATEGC